jgi:hypothetical protein
MRASMFDAGVSLIWNRTSTGTLGDRHITATDRAQTARIEG